MEKMTYELRGIILSYPSGRESINLVVRDQYGEDYQTFEYPDGKKLDQTSICEYLAKQLKCDIANLSVPRHIKFPEGWKK